MKKKYIFNEKNSIKFNNFEAYEIEEIVEYLNENEKNIEDIEVIYSFINEFCSRKEPVYISEIINKFKEICYHALDIVEDYSIEFNSDIFSYMSTIIFFYNYREYEREIDMLIENIISIEK